MIATLIKLLVVTASFVGFTVVLLWIGIPVHVLVKIVCILTTIFVPIIFVLVYVED